MGELENSVGTACCCPCRITCCCPWRSYRCVQSQQILHI